MVHIQQEAAVGWLFVHLPPSADMVMAVAGIVLVFFFFKYDQNKPRECCNNVSCSGLYDWT